MFNRRDLFKMIGGGIFLQRLPFTGINKTVNTMEKTFSMTKPGDIICVDCTFKIEELEWQMK